jgi:hypothetical protein
MGTRSGHAASSGESAARRSASADDGGSIADVQERFTPHRGGPERVTGGADRESVEESGGS